jgi:hypothetical protein
MTQHVSYMKIFFLYIFYIFIQLTLSLNIKFQIYYLDKF